MKENLFQQEDDFIMAEYHVGNRLSEKDQFKNLLSVAISVTHTHTIYIF